MANKLAELAATPADYERFHLSPTTIEPWEDGARTDGSSGTYEWWYFDAHLADGAKLVVSFMDKNLADVQKPLTPLLRLNLELPDGRVFDKVAQFPPTEWSAAKDHADVHIGENRFTGDLHNYQIQATADDISIDVTLKGEVPPWRPSTGYMLFGQDRSLEFAWLPSVPEGDVTGSYSIGGEKHETTGIGYHDHNWGNVGLMQIVHDWYWARGQAGPYSVIASYITAAEKYKFESIPVFMLARDNVIVGDDPAKVTFERDGIYTDAKTGKPVATTTRYTYRDGEDRYVVSFTRKGDLATNRMADSLSGIRRIAAKLMHFDGAYLRFAGDLEISRYHGEDRVETYRDDAIWELMYFGHAR